MASPREHSLSYRVEHWRGTPDDIANLFGLIRQGLDKMSDDDDGVRGSINVEFANGSQRFDSAHDFSAAERQILGDTVTAITVRGHCDSEESAASVRFGYGGAEAAVTSTDEIWAQGLLAVVRRELDMQAQPPTQQGYDVPRDLLVSVGLATATTIGVSVAASIALKLPTEVWASLGAAIFLFWSVFTAVMVRDFTRRTKPFELVSVEQSKADRPHIPSWSHRVHAWITARPLLNLVLGFALGIATNKASDLL